MNIVPDPLSGGSRLAQAYIHRYDSVSGFYGEDYRSSDGYERRAAWLDQSEAKRISRAAVVDCLRTYNHKFNAHPAVDKALDALGQPETLAIVGGQQSGLLTGPILVIYKAVTIIQAASDAAKRLNRPVVPVFWIAGEDHDWDEVNHAYFLTRDLDIAKIKLDPREKLRTSVSYTEVNEEEWELQLQGLRELLPDSPSKAELLELARTAFSGSRNLSEGFAKLLGAMFGKHGLILLDSADPNLRALEVPVFEAIINNNEDLGLSYQQMARDIEGAGFEVQADVPENGANLFYLHEGMRLLLYREGDRFVDRKGWIQLSRDELLRELHEHPARFSNNVLTRPLMQDSLLPVLGTVLGMGEISYWAITRGAFAEMGLQMPLILPRMSFTLLDNTVHKHMDKYALSFQDVQHHLEEKRQAWLDSQDELNLEERFGQTKAAFEQLYQPLIEDLGKLQSGLVKLGSTNKDKILKQMDYLLRKSQEALEQQHEAALRQWQAIGQSLMPLGRPQERVYNIFHYMNRYGMDLIDRLMEIPYEASGTHRLIHV